MTYLVLDVVFLAVAGAVVLVAHARGVRPSLRAIAWSMLVLAVMTIVFDNLMIAAGLFGFDDDQLVGLRFWRAPVEDLGYPFAVALLLPALWHLLGRGRRGGAVDGARTTGTAADDARVDGDVAVDGTRGAGR